MSPPAAVPMLDAALEAIVTFLGGIGLGDVARAVETAHKDSHAGPGVADLGAELHVLVGSLQRAADICGDPLIAKGDLDVCSAQAYQNGQLPAGHVAALEVADMDVEWVDEMLHRIYESDCARFLPSELAARLEEAMSEAPLDTADGAHQTGPADGRPSGKVASEDTRSTVSAIAEAEMPALIEEVPPAPPPPTAPSAHYVAKRGDNYDLDIPEEYRDDNDPGYRIREVTEAELVGIVQEKYCVGWSAPSGGREAPPAPAAGQCDGADAAVAAGRAADESEARSEPVSPSSGGLKNLVKSAGSKMLAALGVGSGCSSEAQASVTTDCEASTDASHEAAQAVAAQAEVWAQPAVTAMQLAQAQAQAAFAAQVPPAGYAYAYVAPQAQQAVVPPHALASRRKEKRHDRPAIKYADSTDPFYPVELDGVIYDSFSLRVVYERDRTGFEESKEFPIRINSIVAARYQVLEYLGSAAFSRAVQCLDLQTNRMVCMKIIKNDKDFLDQSLDEIKLLKIINANTTSVDDKHCLALVDYFYHKEHLIIVTELLRDNLYEFSKFNRECGEEPYFTIGRLQRITKQVLVALEYIHGLWLIHADLKPENILVKSYSRCEVKVIDFGSSCFVDDQLTSYVQSRSYRAPEVMLGLPYNQKIDMWSLGCIIAELWTGYVLFQNDSVQSLLARIIGIIGPFPTHMMSAGRFVPQYFTQDAQLYRESEAAAAGGPGSPIVPERRLHLYLPKRSSLRQRMRTDDDNFIEFLAELLQVDPAQRPTAVQALRHPWLAPGRYPDGL